MTSSMLPHDLNSAIVESFEEFRRHESPELLLALARLKADDIIYTHFGLGLHLRNTILKPECRLYQLFVINGFMHPDDMSSIIIEAWFAICKTEFAAVL